MFAMVMERGESLDIGAARAKNDRTQSFMVRIYRISDLQLGATCPNAEVGLSFACHDVLIGLTTGQMFCAAAIKSSTVLSTQLVLLYTAMPPQSPEGLHLSSPFI